MPFVVLAFAKRHYYSGAGMVDSGWKDFEKSSRGSVLNPIENGKRRVWQTKNAGLKVVTLIATLNPVSQVLW